MPKFVLRGWPDRPAPGRFVMDSWNGTLMGSSPTAGFVLRWVRALVLAAVVLPLGAVAHSAGHGGLPPIGTLFLLLLGVAALAAPLLRGEASTVRVLGFVVGGQVFVHTALTVLAAQGTPSSAVLSAHTHMTGMAHGTRTAADASGAALTATALPVGELGMVLTHLAAALGVGLWLAVGERALWSMLRLAGGRVQTVLDGVLGVVPAAWAPSEVGPATAERGPFEAGSVWRGSGALGRRGPPVVLAS